MTQLSSEPAVMRSIRREQAFPKACRNLMAVSLLGMAYGACKDAATARAAVELTLDDPTQFRVCCAIAHGIAGDTWDACHTLARHIEQNPADESARVAMSVSLLLAGDAAWRSALDERPSGASTQRPGVIRTG